MTAPKKGLGRGFDSLIPTELLDETFEAVQVSDHAGSLQELPLSKVHANPDQPRRHFDQEALNELAASVKEHGVLQPIIVAPHNGGYQIVAGERRFRAATQAGLATIPAVVRSFGDQHKLEVSLIENIQRRDLNSVETAVAYAALRDQFNLSNEQIAGRVHKSIPAVVNTMRLLKLPKQVLVAIAEGKLSEGQSRPLIGLEEEVAISLAQRIIDEGWTTRQVEQYIVNLKSGRQPKALAEVKSIESRHEAKVASLKQRLATDVNIQLSSRGSGKIIIKFKTEQDLERIQKLLDS